MAMRAMEATLLAKIKKSPLLTHSHLHIARLAQTLFSIP